MFHDQARKIRALFTADTETRNIFGGPPYTNDIVAELVNADRFIVGRLTVERTRLRLGAGMSYIEENPVAYMSLSLVSDAQPTAHERKYVWENRPPEKINGVFIRRLIVCKNKRRQGYATGLIEKAKLFALEKGKRLYGDMKASNAPMRALAMKCGGQPNMFWNTPRGTLMVRYIW